MTSLSFAEIAGDLEKEGRVQCLMVKLDFDGWQIGWRTSGAPTAKHLLIVSSVNSEPDLDDARVRISNVRVVLSMARLLKGWIEMQGRGIRVGMASGR